MSEAPKIVVDSDWKSQAQAEKQRLAAKEQAKAPPAAPAVPGEPAAPAPASAGKHPEEAPADFIEIVRMFASQALLYLGAIPDPETGRAILAPEAARFNIDLLGVLEQKTKGNLTEEESKILTTTSHELRLQYVEVSRAIEKAIADGRIKEVRAPGAAGSGIVMPAPGAVPPGALGSGGLPTRDR